MSVSKQHFEIKITEVQKTWKFWLNYDVKSLEVFPLILCVFNANNSWWQLLDQNNSDLDEFFDRGYISDLSLSN